jgi:hypothetical protein
MPKPVEPIVINFKKEKITKNTIRFQEVPDEGKPPVMGTLYAQKWAVGENCENLKVTLEVIAA